MNEKIIIDYLTNHGYNKIEIVNRLMGGMSNYTYLINIDKKKYTFRIPGMGAEYFTNRKQENLAMQHIKDLDLLPIPLLLDEDNGYKLASYVEGTPLSEIENKPLEAVAQILKKLHNSGKYSFDYNPLQRLEKYESLSKETDSVYLALKDKFLEIYNEFLYQFDLVACHGDSQVSNFIQDDKRIYLLDWEFAGNNDPIYDIACFGNYDFEDALDLIEIYFANAGKIEYQRLYAWRMFQCLQWHCVAKYKHEIGLSERLAIDFNFVATSYLKKAKSFFQDYLNVKGD